MRRLCAACPIPDWTIRFIENGKIRSVTSRHFKRKS